MTAALMALAVFLGVLAVGRRRPSLEAFLSAAPAVPAPNAKTLRLHPAAPFGAATGAIVGLGGGSDAVAAALAGTASAVLAGKVAAGAARRRRVRRLRLELPTVADTLALHVLAGDSVSAGLHRLVASGTGVVVSEVRSALSDEAAGLDTALRITAARLDSEAARLFDLLADAHRTGGRLAEALGVLADDYRAAAAADLTAEGGRRAMAVYGPILALMVPVTLVFLMYPTLAGLTALSTP